MSNSKKEKNEEYFERLKEGKLTKEEVEDHMDVFSEGTQEGPHRDADTGEPISEDEARHEEGSYR